MFRSCTWGFDYSTYRPPECLLNPEEALKFYFFSKLLLWTVVVNDLNIDDAPDCSYCVQVVVQKLTELAKIVRLPLPKKELQVSFVLCIYTVEPSVSRLTKDHQIAAH